MKKLSIILLFLAACSMHLIAQPITDGELTELQIQTLLMKVTNMNLQCDQSGVWHNNLTLWPKGLAVTVEHRDLVKKVLSPGFWCEKITITRIGKVQANGVIAVQFNIDGKSYYDDQNNVSDSFTLYSYSLQGRIARISKSTNDFGDIFYNCAPSVESWEKRMLGTTVSLTLDQINSLSDFLSKSTVAVEEKPVKDLKQPIAPEIVNTPVPDNLYTLVHVGSVFKGTYEKGANDVIITITNINTENANSTLVFAKVDCLIQHKSSGSYAVKGKIDIEQNGMVLDLDKIVKMPFLASARGFNGKFSYVNGKLKWEGKLVGGPTTDFAVVEQ
jgi:hypothetical protein